MDYKELLKKYWFVCVVGIALIAFVGVYAADAYNHRELTVGNKQIDGKYVVYSVDGENVFADDFYDSLYTQTGLSSEFTAYQRAILNSAYETTEDMETLAANYSSYYYQQYGEEYLISQLQSMGYVNGSQDLNNYFIDTQKSELLVKDYLKANETEILTPFIQENDPRVIYHILVKVADIETITDEDGKQTYKANPTEEETKKLNDILEALKTTPFQEVAMQYSDDTSGQAGGYIGCISNLNGSNYYPVFTEASMKLKNDEVSDVVTSSAGYHIIWNAGNSVDTLLNDSEFITELQNLYPTIQIKAVTEKATELGFEIVDQKLQSLIDAQLESGDAE